MFVFLMDGRMAVGWRWRGDVVGFGEFVEIEWKVEIETIFEVTNSSLTHWIFWWVNLFDGRFC